MSNTFSSWPFTSHDGPDTNGFRAEVSVVTGFGSVASVEKSSAGKAVKVAFAVSNTRFKPAGWVPIDDPVMDIINEAQDSGEPIHFRIETRRKEKVDRRIPIEELGKDVDSSREHLNKALTAAKREDDTEWTISPLAKTNMAEDPSTGTANSANDFTVEELRKFGGNATPSASATSPSSANSPKGNGWKNSELAAFEPPHYVSADRDGNIWPGSTDAAVPLTIYSFVGDYAKDNGIDLDSKRKFAVVRSILEACNEAQLGIYDNKFSTPDPSLPSHTRARALVFESARSLVPLTKEIMDDDDLLAEWKEGTVAKVLKMWRWSIKLATEMRNAE